MSTENQSLSYEEAHKAYKKSVLRTVLWGVAEAAAVTAVLAKIDENFLGSHYTNLLEQSVESMVPVELDDVVSSIGSVVDSLPLVEIAIVVGLWFFGSKVKGGVKQSRDLKAKRDSIVAKPATQS